MGFLLSNCGHLRISVCAVRHRNSANVNFLEEKRILDHSSRLHIRVVSELGSWHTITNSVDILVCCQKVLIYLYAKVRVKINASGLKPQSIDVRNSTNREQNRIKLLLYLRIIVCDQGCLNSSIVKLLEHFWLRFEEHLHTILKHRFLQVFDAFLVVSRQEMWAYL